MKLNMFYPPMGSEKCFEFDDIMLQPLYDKRISQEVSGDFLGDMFKGYVFRISGGNDKQGFAMKQGVLVNHRVRLLLADGSSCYRPRREGERRRKSVRGCIVGPDLSVLNLVIIQQGDKPIPGLTDAESAVPRRRGPKRASTIRKLFNLSKKDDVKKYVVRRVFVNKKGKKIDKAPKIQRLITPVTLQRKRARAFERKSHQVKVKLEAAEYHKLLSQKARELKAKRASSIAKRLGSQNAKPKVEEKAKKAEVKQEKKLVKQPKMEKEVPKEKQTKQPAQPKVAKKAAEPKKQAPESKKQTQKPGGKTVPKLESKPTEKAKTKEVKVTKTQEKKAQPKKTQPAKQGSTQKPKQTQPTKQEAAPKPKQTQPVKQATTQKPAAKPAQKPQKAAAKPETKAAPQKKVAKPQQKK